MKSSTSSRRPYRMGARAQTTEATRESILEAAMAAFWAAPADDIVLDDVAEQAGVSVRTVLRHFGSKRELLEAAGQREAGRVRRQRDTAPPGDVPGAVRVLVEHYEEMGDSVLRLLAEEQRMPSLRRIADAGRVTHRDWCRRVFAGALAPVSGVDHDRRLAQLVAVCDVHTWKLLRRDAGLSRRQTELALVELLEPLTEAAS